MKVEFFWWIGLQMLITVLKGNKQKLITDCNICFLKLTFLNTNTWYCTFALSRKLNRKSDLLAVF